MSRCIDFNCDLGEGGADEAAILPHVSSASLACGFHAGEPAALLASIRACQASQVAIGAHPAHADRAGFGRREQALSGDEAYALTLYQLGALEGLVRSTGARLRHVKPHGALYNQAAREPALAAAIAAAVRDFDPRLILYGLSGSALTAAGEAAGLRIAHEVFVERRYEADGRLTPRSAPDAVIESLDEAISQLRQLLQGFAIARTGERIALRADTVCLHGDRADAAAFAAALHGELKCAGIAIRPLGDD